MRALYFFITYKIVFKLIYIYYTHNLLSTCCVVDVFFFPDSASICVSPTKLALCAVDPCRCREETGKSLPAWKDNTDTHY